MIKAWRLSKARYAADLSGVGSARDGQRWNPPGQPAVYLGLTPEITVLELMVHLNGVFAAPLVLCSYAVPDEPRLIARPRLKRLCQTLGLSQTEVVKAGLDLLQQHSTGPAALAEGLGLIGSFSSAAQEDGTTSRGRDHSALLRQKLSRQQSQQRLSRPQP